MYSDIDKLEWLPTDTASNAQLTTISTHCGNYRFSISLFEQVLYKHVMLPIWQVSYLDSAVVGVVGGDRGGVGHAAVAPQPPHIWGCTVVGDHPLLQTFYSCK